MEKKRLVVIGGVAAGTKAASKAKRENQDLEVIVITREKDVSYAGCGLPYFIGGVISERRELVVRSPEAFEQEQGIYILTECEVTAINPQHKNVTFKEKNTGEIRILSYDYLVLATGASPAVPRIEGWNLSNIYNIRTIRDAEAVRELVDLGEIKDAVVVGAGFIGLECAENLTLKGINVTIVEMAPLVLPGYDEELSLYIKNYLQDKGIKIMTGTGVKGFTGDNVGRVMGVKTGEDILEAQLVIWAGGVRPNVELAKNAGIKLGPTGAIEVNEFQETNMQDVFAAGDCAESVHLITKEKVWLPMGSTANKTGRIAGLNLAKGRVDQLPGVLGTSIVKLFELQAARTGLTEKQARGKGFDVKSVLVPSNDKAHYYPGYRQIITKLIAESKSGRILGAQIVGEGVVDKPIDIIATMISCGGTIEQLGGLDLAYAPPFSMAMSSNILAAHVLKNKIDGKFQGLNPRELYEALGKEDIAVLDIRTEPEYLIKAIPESINIPFNQLAERKNEIPADKKIVVVCKVGKRAYLTLNVLKQLGLTDIMILDGGLDCYPYTLI